MVQLIIGEKGKGKTKIILENANAAAEKANGNIVFVDADSSHMYDLKNTIRLVNAGEYMIEGADAFAGFIAGIISADHDLEELFVDRLLISAKTDAEGAKAVLAKLDKLAEKYSVKITISVSLTKDQLPDGYSDKVVEAL